MVLLTACASTPPPPPPPPDWNDALRAEAKALAERLRAEALAPASQVRVRLAFSRDVDLDLYVTDPTLETVYYANTPVRSGGALERDGRCSDDDAEEVRVETIGFEAPAKGSYRVGVDYPHRCDDDRDVMPYALSLEANGERELQVGLTRWLDFITVAAELEVR